MRIGVLTLVAGIKYHDAVRPGLRTKREYCEQYGYDYLEIVDHSLPQMAALPVSWHKLRFLADILVTNAHDVVFCSDADVCITNPAIRIETILEKHFPSTKDLLFSRQSVWAPWINAGNFFARNTLWARVFLREWFRHGRKYEIESRRFWEQAYLNDMYDVYANEEVIEHVQVVRDQRLFNSFHLNWQPGDFLIHFPGLRGERLKRAMEYGASCDRSGKGIQVQSWFHSLVREEFES